MALGLAHAAGLCAATAEENMGAGIGIVDTHQHLWDLKRLRLPWLPASGPLAGDHVMADYLKEARGLDIERTIYMEVDVAPEQHVEEAAYALSLIGKRGSPMVGAIIGGRPADEGFAAYMSRFKAEPRVRGVRQVLHSSATPQGYCLQAGFLKGVQRLGEMGLAFDVCLPAPFLGDAAKLADACPETRLIIDHCGNPNVQQGVQDNWMRDMAAIARRPNVACKISGIVATAKQGAWSPDDLAPFIAHCRDVFGPERIVFGSDWPVCTLVASLREWVTALRQIIAHWPLPEQRKLLRDNAARWYRIR